MDDHEPSDIIPLFNGMTISFINYELQVRIEPKSPEELQQAQFENIDLNLIDYHATQSHGSQAKEEEQKISTPHKEASQSHRSEVKSVKSSHKSEHKPQVEDHYEEVEVHG